jgi:hypothetical protein
MENEKDRVTIRIEENATPAEVEAAAAKLEEPKETAVVMVRDKQAIVCAYYEGFHDGCRDYSSVIMMLSAAITVLLWMLLRATRATE